jgi:hypothetical protein
MVVEHGLLRECMKMYEFDRRIAKFFISMGLYHPLDGDTNLKYKLLCFLTPDKKNFKEKGNSF